MVQAHKLWRNRSLRSRMALVLVLVAAVLAVIAVSMTEVPFAFGLALWFAGWLALFHVIIAIWKSMTQLHVRLIDYIYVGAGVIALLLAAAQETDERARQVKLYQELSTPGTKQELLAYLDAPHSSWRCSDRELRPRVFCDWVAEIRQFLMTDFALDALLKQVSRAQELQQSQGWKRAFSAGGFGQRVLVFLHGYGQAEMRGPMASKGPPSSSELVLHALVDTGDAGALIIQSLSKIGRSMGNIQSASSGQVSATSGDVQFLLLRLIGWPLVLAMALALRITKVTAEISGVR